MDFIPLIDAIGEPATGAVIGLGLGALFGIAAERSGFCTRSAALQIGRGKGGSALPVWLAGFAAAVLLTQALLAAGMLDVSDTRFFGTAQSLSGALIGGALFGTGMVLTRGCASRLVVLSATGNLRALFSIAIITAVAWATYQGPLVPLRNAVASLLSTSAIGGNDLAAVTGAGSSLGLIAGALLAVAAIAAALRYRPSPALLAGGLAVGALIPAGWYFTYQLSLQLFEPVQADSLSFMRPLANSWNYVSSGGDDGFLGVDVGLIAGTLFGALAASLAAGSFKLRTFSEEGSPHIARYAAGAVLMGFGGILAVGCTIGAGFTGGAVLAINGLVGLAAMMLSAIVADRVIEARGHRDRIPAQPAIAPAE